MDFGKGEDHLANDFALHHGARATSSQKQISTDVKALRKPFGDFFAD
jgi:hypothetical protein